MNTNKAILIFLIYVVFYIVFVGGAIMIATPSVANEKITTLQKQLGQTQAELAAAKIKIEILKEGNAR